MYVAFLNEYISQAKEAFLYERASDLHIKLNPINSDIGSCVPNGNDFECQCKPNYQIMVSPLLKETIENFIGTRQPHNERNVRLQEFVTFVLLLKYHPLSAGLYFAYLINHHRLTLMQVTLELVNPWVQDSNTGSQLKGGLIENKGSCLDDYEERIFKDFLQKIIHNKCNIRKFAVDNFDDFSPFAMFLFFLTNVRAFLQFFGTRF